jgi:hypothetical protein
VSERGVETEGLASPGGIRIRWTIRELMLLILGVGVALAVLRVRWGIIFALMAGGAVGCGLAPWHACREMRKLDETLARNQALPTRTRSRLLAESYVLVWAAWYFAGVLVALAGVASWWILRRPAPGAW